MRRRRRLPLLRLIPLLAAAAVCGAACSGTDAASDDAASGPADGSSPPIDGAPAPVPVAEWRPCGVLECATVEVPLDHDRPQATTIALELVRVRASDPAARMGSLFVNPGGPGASGIEMVEQGFRFDPTTMAHYDLVGFDPRGVGRSTPLRCQVDLTASPLPDPSPDDAAEATALDAAARDIAQRCGELDGELLPHLDSWSVARDLDLLRQAVGDERLNYVGFSYGTLLGLRYLELFGDRAGRIVLDGVVDPSATLVELLGQQVDGIEIVFNRMADACGGAGTCPPSGLVAAYDRVAAMVEAEPRVGVGPAELATAATMATYDPSLWPVLNEALSAALAGDVQGIEALADLYLTSGSFVAYAGVSCTDGPVPRGADQWDAVVAGLAARSPRFGPAAGNELRVCAHWPAPAGGEPQPVRAAASGPVLVIGTTGDVATPLANAETVARALPGGHLLVYDGEGHTAYGDPCVDRAVRHYLVDGAVPPPGARC